MRTNDVLLFLFPQPFPDFLGSVRSILRSKDSFLTSILGGYPREIELGKDAILRVFEVFKRVGGYVACDPR
jgi:hypothetical protein